MNSDVAIEVEGLGKRYRIGRREGYLALRDLLTDALRAPFRRSSADDTAAETRQIWALRDVSFDVRAGEALGVIGRNGAGKSTLLKILARITQPTAGRALIRGAVGSLLEVGTGFHQELTGRENVYLNGAILGMKKSEITRRFDEIVAFAGVETFVDTPVKFYSSGMRVRLAFAVAAHLEPDVLLMDEVLAVGDAAFQQKCLSKMGEVAHGGRTVLFVSHNLGAVRSLCSRAIWLEGGTLRGNGAPDEVIAEYLQQMAGELSSDGAVQLSEADGDDGPVRLLSVALKDGDGHVQSQFQSDESVFVEVAYRVKERVTGMRVNLQLKTRTGDLVFVTTDHDQRDELDAHGDYVSRCEIPKALLNTELYTVGVAIGIPGLRVLVPQRDLLTLSIAGVGQHGSSYPERWPGVVAPRLRWTVERAS